MSEKVCIVCLKTFQSFHNGPPKEGEGVALLTKFFKFTENYLQLLSSPTIHQLIRDCDDETARNPFCENCELSIVTPICNLYLELVSVKLRLSWLLQPLEKGLDNFQWVFPPESGVNNIELLTDQLGIETVVQLDEFRSLLAQRCQLMRLAISPQISLGSRCDDQELETDNAEQVLANPLVVEAGAPAPLEVGAPAPDRLALDDAPDPFVFEAVVPDPLDIQCDNDEDNSNAEENVEPENIVKVEKFHVGNEQESIPENDVTEQVEAPMDSASNLPSTSNSWLLKLFNPSPPTRKKENILSGCPTCGKVLRNNAVLEVHNRNYHKPINCTLCRKTFKGNKTLRNHIRRVHKYKATFKCRVCAKVYPTTASLSIHMRRYHLRFRCSHSGCSASFETKKLVEQHVAAIHKPGVFPCPHCPGMVFSTVKFTCESCTATSVNRITRSQCNPISFSLYQVSNW